MEAAIELRPNCVFVYALYVHRDKQGCKRGGQAGFFSPLISLLILVYFFSKFYTII